MLPGNFRSYPTIPDVRSGFEIYKNAFTLVIPEGKTNYVSNPSAEFNTTGFTGSGATIVQSTTKARRGVSSIQVTPTSIAASGIVYFTVVAPSTGPFTFSVDLFGKGGQKYQVFISDTSGNPIQGVARTGFEGFWKRPSTTAVLTSGTTYRLTVARTGTNGFGAPSVVTNDPFYVDGFQLESGDHPTTYIDGDQIGYVSTQTDFWWDGAPHASTSGRSPYTRAGGREVNLSKFIAIMAVIGLGAAPVQNITSPAVLGGSFYQNTITPERREFTIAGAITGNGTDHINTQLTELWAVLNPLVNSPKQSMTLKYRAVDDCGNPTGETWNIPCYYAQGLESGPQNGYQMRVGLNFVQYFPMVEREGDTAKAFPSPVQLSNSFTAKLRSIKRDGATGAYSEFISTAYPAGTTSISKGIKSSTGDYWLILDDNKLYKYSNGVFSVPVTAAMGVNNGVLEMPTKNIIVWGNTLGINMVNSVTLAVTNVGASFDVAPSASWGIAYNPNNQTYYITGFMTTPFAQSVTTKDFVTYAAGPTLPSAWSTGNNAGVTTFGDRVYYWGQVTATTASIYMYTIGGAITTIVPPAATTIILVGTVDPNNGTFYYTEYQTNGTPQYWTRTRSYNPNGGSIQTVSIAQNQSAGGTPYQIPAPILTYPYFDGFGNAVYYYGGVASLSTTDREDRNYINGIRYPSAAFMYAKGNTFYPSDLIAAGNYASSALTNVVFLPNGDIIFNMSPATAYNIGSQQVSVFNAGTLPTTPKIQLFGPNGRIYQITNVTTNQSIILSGLRIQANEVVTISFSNGNASLTSNVRGDLSSYIMPGSDMGFSLAPGTNYLVVGNAYTTAMTSTGTVANTLAMEGRFISGVNVTNSDNYILYISTAVGGLVNFYKDSARSQLVAHAATGGVAGNYAMVADNSSGIGGFLLGFGAVADTGTMQMNAPIIITWNDVVDGINAAK